MHYRFLLLCLTIIISSLFFPCLGGVHPAVRENEGLLLRLDSIIAGHQALVDRKENRIGALRKTLRCMKSDVDRLGVARQLYDEYLVYDSDSALYYATQSRELLERVRPGDYDGIVQWSINEAFMYIVQGMYDNAMELMQGIDSSRLSREMKASYFGYMAYAYSMRALYVHSNHQKWKKDISKANEYRDSVRTHNLALEGRWLWVSVAMAVDTEEKDVKGLDIADLKKYVDSTDEPSRDNAINAYWLARYYEAAGDSVNMVRYMTLAAIYDALIVNREIAALQELATWLFDHEQLNRAYNYLLYTVHQANMYHNRYRMVSLSDVLPMVRDAYRNEVEKRDRRLLVMVVALSVLAVVLLGCIIFIIMEFRKLSRTRTMLADANAKLGVTVADRDRAIAGLEQANTGLTRANARLREANKQKLGLLAYAFRLTTDYINAMEDYRKKLLRKYKARKIDDLGILINDPELIKEQYQVFYENFDKAVLSIFPDFIEEYNSTVGEDDKVSRQSTMKTGILNTKLRIHALRRLGISKSADIAKMLNLSIRTVYNNRVNSGVSDDGEQDPSQSSSSIS